MALTDRTVRDLLAAFRSSEPTPGGGSASALAGAAGAALLAMVATLGRPRAATAADLDRLSEAGRRLTELSEDLTTLIDRDSESYVEVMAAYKLPKASDEEKRSRAERIQRALEGAITAPLEVMRRCVTTVDCASVVATLGNRNAASDVGVALELLAAALRGARLNVEINLDGLKDPARVEEVRVEVARLTEQLDRHVAAAREQLTSA